MRQTPVYYTTKSCNKIQDKVKAAYSVLKSCSLCPRDCNVNRLSGEVGHCRTGEKAVVASFNAHFGEERPLVGSHGSGTIFFTHCSLSCIFCQNWDISHMGVGEEADPGQLADIMMILQSSGCHNINFVTPTHVVPQIIKGVDLAIDKGLAIPLVYNCSGYEKIETLKLLNGIVDIYMPDFKFFDPKIADLTCNAPDYPVAAKKAVTEMHRQVGDLVTDEKGIARRGLLVRHLVLPSGMGGTREVMEFIAREISSNTYVNVMSQYRPWGRADQVSELSRPVSYEEYRSAVQEAKSCGIKRLDRL